ncbi:MAG: hypothetical protein WCV63_06300 [Negativicutes bacterium]|jgi:Tfp pilus assembly protein PilV
MFERCLGNNKGFALPIVLVALGVVSVVVVAVLSMQSLNVSTADSQGQGIRSQFLAEYGARAAIRKLIADSTYRTNTNSLIGVTDTVAVSDVGGRYVVKCSNSSPITQPLQRIIQSNGEIMTMGFATASRTLVLDNPPLTLVSPQDNMGNYSFFSLGAFSLSGSASVTGNVGTLSTTTLSGSTTINGSVAAAGINCPAWCTITGTRTSGYTSNLTAAMKPGTTSTITGLNRSNYSAYSAPSGATNSGSNYTYDWQSRTIAGGTYYCPGTLKFSDSGSLTATGPVIIYSVGNVQIGGSGSLNGTFMIISEGKINVDGAAVVNKAVLISGGNFTDGGSGSVKGSVVSFGTCSVSGAGFVYDQAAFDGFSDIESQLTVTNPGWSGGGSGNWEVQVGGYY